MSTNTQRILIIQHASGELGFKSFKETLFSLSLDDKIMVLAIIQQTSTTVHRGILKEIAGIRILAEVQQVEFGIAVEAGSLNEVVVEYAKKFEATRVLLPRKEELRFINLNHRLLILAIISAEVPTNSRNYDTVCKLFDKMSDSDLPYSEAVSLCCFRGPQESKILIERVPTGMGWGQRNVALRPSLSNKYCFCERNSELRGTLSATFCCYFIWCL
ncbi:Uncharacterized protein Adt_47135 [Abeliophyllum distichum]|uniref:Uncharacterized protein n=1 Tax=Abeliophyllum distichum TaxID=126358 RepID=A0ABD1NYU2_9LAMI